MRRLIQPFLISLLVLGAKQWAESSEVWLDSAVNFILGQISWGEDKSPPQALIVVLRYLVAFLTIFLSLSLIIEFGRSMVSMARRSRLVKSQQDVKSLFDDVGHYHRSMEQRVRHHHVDLPENIKGVWLEYILTDLVKALGQSFGRNDFRASVFVPFPGGDENQTRLISVASSMFHPIGYARSMFEMGEGFCGHCFKTQRISAGSHRFGFRGVFRKNPLFADNRDDLRKDADQRRSFVCFPIRMRPKGGNQVGEVVAVISIDSRNKYDFRNINGDVQFLAHQLEKQILPVIGRHVIGKRYDND